MINKVFTLCLLVCSFSSFSQNERDVKDDPIGRVEFDYLRLKNPVTGKIPKNIRKGELEIARNILSKQLKSKSNLNKVTSDAWSLRGPYNVGGRTRALAVDVNNESIILAGGVSGGMWRTTDQGSTWTKVTVAGDLHNVTAIAQDTRAGQTDTWYYGTGELSGNSASGTGAFFLGNGIFKSLDNGVTWSLIESTVSDTPTSLGSSDEFEIVNELAVCPVTGTLYAATFFGIFKSENGGTSFEKLLDNANEGWTDVSVSSTGLVYATLEGDAVYFSDDNGDTWTDISSETFTLVNGERIEVAIAPSNEDIVYVICEDGTRDFFDDEQEETISGYALWKYDASDSSWVDLSDNIPFEGGASGHFDSQGGYDLLIKVKPDDPDFVIIGGLNLYRSTDGFSTGDNITWIGGYTPTNTNFALYPNHHPDQHSFVFLSGDRALSGNDGGVQLTDDITEPGGFFAVKWSSLNNGYSTTQSYAVSAGPGDQIMSGFQDNGTWLTTTTEETVDWSTPFGGDGAYSAFNSDGTVRFVSSQNANIFRLNYSGPDDIIENGFAGFTPELDNYQSGLFITPFYIDPFADSLFYLAGAGSLYVNTSAETGSSSEGWKNIDLGFVGTVSEIGTAYNRVYVGGSLGAVVRVDNPGTETPTATRISDLSLPNGYVSGLASNLANPDELLISFSNYEIPSLFYTADGGETWTDVSGNLEENTDGTGNGPSVRSVAILGYGDKYFAATSTGLYSTELLDGENTVWEQEGVTSIGNIVVEHVITKLDGTVIIGSHANGVFSNTFSVANAAQPSDIFLSTQSVLENQEVASTVGALSSFDLDGDTHTYSLVEGEGDTGNASFQVDNGSGELQTAEVLDFEVQAEYTIRIQTEDVDGQTFVKSFTIQVEDDEADNPLALENIDKYGIVVYPNPVKDRLRLELNNDYRGLIEVSLVSAEGKTILNKLMMKNGAITDSFMDIEDLEDGIYIMKIRLGDDRASFTLIKE